MLMSSSLFYYQKSASKRCVVALMPGIEKKRNPLSLRFVHLSRASIHIVQAPIHLDEHQTCPSCIASSTDFVELTSAVHRKVRGLVDLLPSWTGGTRLD